MRRRQIFIIFFGLLCTSVSFAIEDEQADFFSGRDLHLAGAKVVSYQPATGEYLFVFPDGFSMSIGANQFGSARGVVKLKSRAIEYRGRKLVDYDVWVYLEDNLLAKKGAAANAAGLSEKVIEADKAMVVQFRVGGEVLVTADKREINDFRGLDLYKKAAASFTRAEPGPRFVVQPRALVPQWPSAPVEKAVAVKKEKPGQPRLFERTLSPPAKTVFPEKVVKPIEVKLGKVKPGEVAIKAEQKEPKFVYPVNIAPAGETKPKIESIGTNRQEKVATVTGRFYLWQKQNEEGGLLELQADNGVIYYLQEALKSEKSDSDEESSFAGNAVKAVYLSGDVVMTEGPRTIRADELFYDFQQKKGLVINAEMRSFDIKRGMPIYVRAAKLRLLSENKFSANDVTLTSSEFYLPQISTTASSLVITNTTAADEQSGKISDSSFDAEMRDVRMKVGNRTVFRWPYLRANAQRPDTPLKSVHFGTDEMWGTAIQTQWHLSRLLGLKEPEGVDSTASLDYFSKRGVGVGAEIEYCKENYFGRIVGYYIKDHGKDRLGRSDIRKDVEFGNDNRGRFGWRHRQFLPHKWQLTAGFNYLSDENFLEQYSRREFNVGNSPETYLHLKKITDNKALSILVKGRINDFADELEELPSVEHHLTGESVFGNAFTLYSDSQISRFRQRIGDGHSTMIDEDHFTFGSHRTELDMPFLTDGFKMVPFVAGTFAYDDRSGFRRSLVDGRNTGRYGSSQVWLGEVGIRIFSKPLWKVFPNVKSRLWDLNQLRHVVKPYITAVTYAESDKIVEQRDTFNFGVSQRLQTKRGPRDNQRTVDWMRLDTDFVWVNDSVSPSDAGPGPDKFIWAKPFVPMRVFSAPQIFNGDLTSGLGLQRFNLFGPKRNYFSADYIWRISDTTALLSDAYYDMQSGVIQQFNIGYSRLLWPNLSYYIGSRYLRRIQILDEKGSNSFTFAATYKFDPRYTLVFAQQFDFDYGANIRSDITLIRRYHRMFCGFTYSADASLDNHAIIFSIWPQGVPELAMGKNRYMGLGGSSGY